MDEMGHPQQLRTGRRERILRGGIVPDNMYDGIAEGRVIGPYAVRLHLREARPAPGDVMRPKGVWMWVCFLVWKG